MAQAARQASLGGELKVDFEIKAPAKSYYRMLSERPQDIPKASPENIQGCEVRGECGKVGSVLVSNYVIDGQPKVAKERIEALEPEKNLMVFRVIEGDIMNEFKSFLTTLQATPKKRGPGSVVTCRMEYERIDEKVAHPEKLFEMFVQASKDMGEMLYSQV